MPTIEVDGVSYEVREGSNLLQACLSHGLDLPYFCWHPSLGSVGACRQCAVLQYKDAEDTRGKLTMACMTPAADGARLSIRAGDAVAFRASVIEWLMLNHPHDCPVCEEGGECHLQDMTLMTGHTVRRYRGLKRTFRNQYLGPFINHEMNRCITCYRCVRFYRDYAGGRDLDAFGSRNRMYFGRAESGVLESEFAGNLVEVCPTGVFTDKPFSATYTRKWDLASAPSVCHGCGVGCNTMPGERYGRLKRVHNRYHGELNGYFLCDRGRFGAAFVNAETRLRRPGVRRDDGSFDELEAQEAVARAAEVLGGGRVAGIGSPRASMESNFALRQLVGAENFCAGFSVDEAALMRTLLDALGSAGARLPTLREMERADAVLVLGEDIANSAPRIALALRQSVRNRSLGLAAEVSIPSWQDAGVRGHAGTRLSPLFQATPLPTRLDDVTARSLHGHPRALARAGFAIAHALDPQQPGPDDPDTALAEFADAAARALAEAERPLVIGGTGSGSVAVLEAAAAVVRALRSHPGDVAFAAVVPECNSMGAALLGGTRSLEDQLEAAARGEIDTLLVLENDLARRAEPDLLERAFERARVIVLDSVESATAARADLVLPAATFAESDGTWVNYEGRAQRFYRVFQGAGAVAPAWRWLARMAAAASTSPGAPGSRQVAAFAHVDDVIAALVAERPDLAAVAEAGPRAAVRQRAGTRVPRQTHRASGRTAMYADRTMHEPQTPQDTEAPLSFSMEGYRPPDPGALLSYTWSPGWNSNQSIFKFQDEVGGILRGGPAGARIPLSAAPATGTDVPEPFEAGKAPVAVPLQDVFGSDELSARAPALAERAAPAWAVVAAADAQRLGITAGRGVRVHAGDRAQSFVARVDPAMPAGAVGLVAGMTGALGPVPRGAIRIEADPDHKPPDQRLIARG